MQLLPFLATEFLNFNIDGDSINESLYLVNDVKFISTGVWPCHAPNFFEISEREKKLYGEVKNVVRKEILSKKHLIVQILWKY